jgi:hypothetical protein
MTDTYLVPCAVHFGFLFADRNDSRIPSAIFSDVSSFPTRVSVCCHHVVQTNNYRHMRCDIVYLLPNFVSRQYGDWSARHWEQICFLWAQAFLHQPGTCIGICHFLGLLMVIVVWLLTFVATTNSLDSVSVDVHWIPFKKDIKTINSM